MEKYTLRDVYDAIKADGSFKQAKTYEDFASKMNYKGYQDQIYNFVKSQGADVGGSYQAWKNMLGIKTIDVQAKKRQARADARVKAQGMGDGKGTMLMRNQAPVKSDNIVGSDFLDSADAGRRHLANADYSNLAKAPKATETTVKQNVLQAITGNFDARKMQQAGNEPMASTGNANADKYVIKTQKQYQEELDRSADDLIRANADDFIKKSIGEEFKSAKGRYSKIFNADNGLGKYTPADVADWSEWHRATQANRELDQSNMLKDLAGSVRNNLEKWAKAPSTKMAIEEDARRYGIKPEDYLKNVVAPKLQQKIADEFTAADLQRYMPKGDFDYVMGGIFDSTIGSLASTMSRSQRQMRAQAVEMTNEGLNEKYKPGLGAKVGRGAVSFATDSPLYAVAGTGAGAVTGKVIGNGVQTAARMANASTMGRVLLGVQQGLVHGAVTGASYGAMSGAVQNWSTGEDTSIAGYLKSIGESSLHSALSFATMEGIGGAVGGALYNAGVKGIEKSIGKTLLHGSQKIGTSVVKTGTEGFGMAAGDWVANSLSNVGSYAVGDIDKEEFKKRMSNVVTKEGTLESCATAVLFKLMHAKEAFKGEGKNMLDNVRRNAVDFFMSDKMKGNRWKFDDNDIDFLRASGNRNGMDEFEKFKTWAKETKKKNTVDEHEEDADYVGSYYDSIMIDPQVPWDTKAKFSAYVMGAMPESRPLASYHTFTFERSDEKGNLWRNYVNEYSAKGELLSKKPYRNKEERDRIWDKNLAQKENELLGNTWAAAAIAGTEDKEMQKAFLISKGFDPNKPADDPNNAPLVEGIQDHASQFYKEFIEYCGNNGKTTEIAERVATQHGMTMKELFEAYNKEPMKRTEKEHNALVDLRHAWEAELFPETKVHVEQSKQEGKEIVTSNGLGGENPNDEAVVSVMKELSEAEKSLQEALDNNDVFKQVYEELKGRGLRNDEIYQELINQGLTEEDLAPLAIYIHANYKAQGMFEGTQNAIEENVTRRADDMSYRGTLNGEKQEKGIVLYVTDENGRKLLVTSGDVSFDADGNPKDGIGDMLMCVDEATGEPIYVSVKDVKFAGTKGIEDYKSEFRAFLQQRNSEAYAAAAAEQGQEQGGENRDSNVFGSQDTKEKNPELYKIAESLQKKIGGSLSQEEADALVSEMENRAKPARELELTPENWAAEFGENGKVSTPLGEVKMGENQYLKLAQLGRRGKLGMVKPTLESPDLIIEDTSKAKDGDETERDSSYVFVKSFTGKDGERMYHFTSVTVQKEGKEVVISNQEKSANRIKRLMQKGKVVFIKGEPSLHPKTQMEESVPRSDSQDSTSSDNQALGLGINSPELSVSKDSNNSSNLQENGGILTFKDGTPVPVDANGEPDFMAMSAEDGARFYRENYEEDAEKQLDSDIRDMEKVLKNARNAKVKGNTQREKIASHKANKEAVALAQAQLDKANEIRKAMTAGKVAESMKKPETAGQAGTEAMNEATARFVNAPKVEGRRGSITLPNGEKIKGRYVAVPAMSLIPSHDPFNGYKPHEGAPLDEEGHTVNDRDYEHEKESQVYTEEMGGDYGGQALADVPVVNPDGRVVSGNGRTMAGQLAARNGTDGKYVEARNENAEGFGMKAEDLDRLDHARIVFIPDEPLPYDTATFAKFNRNEKKTQSNTQQAVANSKKLSSEEVGAIVSEIEGAGTLDAFFNNPKAINSLVKTLIEKGIIGRNDVAVLMEANGERLSAQGKELVKNLLLGGIFKEETIRMMGIDGGLKTKALNGIRSVMENMKLGKYSLRDEIDNAIQLLYSAKRSRMNVDDFLRQDNAFEENAREKYSQVAQALAKALEGNVSLFRDLMNEYNEVAKSRSTGESDMFGEDLSRDELIRQFLEASKVIKENDIKLYGNEERHQDGAGGNHAAGHEEPSEETGGGTGEEERKPGERVEIVDEAGYDAAVGRLKTADGNERERILDSMEAYVKEYARKNGYDEPVIFRTKQDMADAAKTEKDKAVIENLPEGRHLPGYYEDGKIHICLEHSTGSKELKETFEHESVHADNANDPSRVEMLAAAVEETRELTRRELESVVEGLSHSTYYTDLASRMKDADAIRMLADEALAHLVTHAYKNGVESMSEITDNPTLLNIAKQTFKERENDRRRRERHAILGDKTRERPDIDVLPAKENSGSMGENPERESGNVGRGRSAEDISNREGTKEGISDPAEGLEDAASKFKEEQKKRNGQEDVPETPAPQKPWREMNGEERLAVAEKSPLTEEEIRTKTSEENRDFIDDAIDYLNGNKGFAQQIAYLKIYDDVRNRHEAPADDSGAEDGTQLAAAGDEGGGELGLGTGGEGGRPAKPMDSGTDVPKERGEGDTDDPAVSAGEQGHSQAGGETPGLGGMAAGNTGSERGGGPGGKGGTAKRGRKGGSPRPAGENAGGNPPSKRGTTWRGRTGDEIRQEAEDAKEGLKNALKEMLKRGRGSASISLAGLNSEQIEYVPELMKAVKRYGMALIDKGIYKMKDWIGNIREGIHDEMKEIGFSDNDIDDFIKEMWNSKMTLDGESHTIAEWSAIYGKEQLRKALAMPLEEKRRKQQAAEKVAVKVGDRENIAETLPFLLPEQQEDVAKAETQFFDPKHADDEHGGGNGILFTNGTGTGKTYTGLGIAKRFIKQGKGRVLIVTPSQEKVTDWSNDARNLGIKLTPLVQKDGKGATQDKGEGAVITTFANFRANRKLMEDVFDLVIYDESHKLMESKDARETSTTTAHYRLTNKDFASAQDRVMLSHPLWIEEEKLRTESKRLMHGSESLEEARLNPKVSDAEMERLEDIETRLKEISAEQEKAMPEIDRKARESVGKTKVVFLSATPFNMRENLDYVEGYLFRFKTRKTSENMSADEYAKARNQARNSFYRQNFPHGEAIGSNGKVQPAVTDADLVDKEERAFADRLMELGVMSGRTIDNGYDYSRDFPMVSVSHANEYNTALKEMMENTSFKSFAKDIFQNYNAMSVIYETMKVAAIRERLNEHLKRGRKIVVFHRRVNDRMGLAEPPFNSVIRRAEQQAKALFATGKSPEIAMAREIMDDVAGFKKAHQGLLDWESSLDYRMPREQLRSLFGDAHEYTPAEMMMLNSRRHYIDEAFGSELPDGMTPYEAGRKYGEACFDPEDADVVKQYAPHEITDEEAEMTGVRKPSKKEFDAQKAKYAKIAEEVRRGISDAIQEKVDKGEIEFEVDENGKRVRHVGLFAGADSKGKKHEDIVSFNSDDSPMNIIVVQEASGKEGISLHDTTGKHQRVMVNLALPQSPIAFIQAEGRIYRIGQKSNAIFEYPLLGIDNEISLFAGKFNGRAATTENLALGNMARGLKDAITRGVLTKSGKVPVDGQGFGGREFDLRADQRKTGYDAAVEDYRNGEHTESRSIDDMDTPEPLGFKLVEFAEMKEGENTLEPSAGNGNVSRYIPTNIRSLSIEPDSNKSNHLMLLTGGVMRGTAEAQGRKTLVMNGKFEDLAAGNKFDTIVMNSPNGAEGGTAKAHLEKALVHLNDSGRLVAVLPETDRMNKLLDELIAGNTSLHLSGEVKLPGCAYVAGGVSQKARVVVIDKLSRKEIRSNWKETARVDLSGCKDMEEFFSKLKDVKMPERVLDPAAKNMKHANKAKTELGKLKAFSARGGYLSVYEGFASFSPTNDFLKSMGYIFKMKNQYGQWRYYRPIIESGYEYKKIKELSRLPLTQYHLLNEVLKMSDEDIADKIFRYANDKKKALYANDLKEYAKAVTKMIRGISGRTDDQLERAFNGEDIDNPVQMVAGTKLGMNDVRAVFEANNGGNEELAHLFNKVFDKAKELGLKVSVYDDENSRTAAFYRSDNTLQINARFWNAKEMYDAERNKNVAMTGAVRAAVLTHELIHSVTAYANYWYDHDPGRLPEGLREAARNLDELYRTIMLDERSYMLPSYCKENKNELVAEMADPETRGQLQRMGFWTRLVDAVKKFFTMPKVRAAVETGFAKDSDFEQSSAYNELSKALDKFLGSFDQNAYEAYVAIAGRHADRHQHDSRFEPAREEKRYKDEQEAETRIAEAEDDEFTKNPLRFQIKTPEQRKAAENAYDFAQKHRPDNYKGYALVDMDSPNSSPEYFEKKSLGDFWRRYYNKLRWGNYKLFNLDKTFDENVDGLKGPFPDEFDTRPVDVKEKEKAEKAAAEAQHREIVLRDTVVDTLKNNGMDVSMNTEEGQRVLDEENGRKEAVRTMGSRVKKRMAEIATHYEENKLSAEEQAVVDVFGGKKDRVSFSVETKVGTVIIEMQQGNENHAGAKHSIFRHYGTDTGYFHADEISLIPEIIKNGERTQEGKNFVYTMTKDDVQYKVVTDAKGKKEVFHDFYTNRKAEVSKSSNTQLSARTDETSANPNAKVQNDNVSTKGNEQKTRFFRTANGEAYGFTVGGKIYIDPKIANSETPIHEYAHLWASALKRGNAKEWKNVVGLMKNSRIWNDVVKNYPELKDDDAIADEVIATYSGRRGAERLRKMAEEVPSGNAFEKAEAYSTIAKVKHALDKFWKGVADMLHIHYTSAEEVADMVMKDLLDGVDPRKAMKDAVEDNLGDAPVRFQKVTDKDELEKLDREKTFRMYSGMQELDGKLYSPMAAIIDGKRTDATEIGAWMKADERPDLVKNGKFNLVKTDKVKGAGEGDVTAAYNPYMHTSTSMMNDQFTGAYARGNIKVVEWEIPESEKTSGYRAEGAKDAVGLVPWHSGSVNGLLPKDRQRSVMLSRWRKAVRVVPDSEVAESIAKQLEGTDLAIPWNVVTPNQLKELAKLGVKITTEETGTQSQETKGAFLKQKAELEKKYPQARFVDVKMTKDAYKEWGNMAGKRVAKKKEKRYEDEDSEKLFLSLQQKSNDKKEYYDTVDILSKRIADGRADLYGIPPRTGGKALGRISAGIEIIAAGRIGQDARGADESNENKLRLGKLETEKAVEDWAKGKGAYYTEDDIAKKSKGGKPCAEGGEAIVYVSKDFSKVTKLVDPYKRNKDSIQLCMENTRLFNELFPDSAYTVTGVARDKNGKFRIVMEQPYLDGKQYDRNSLESYENGPSQAKDALMKSLGLKDVDGDGLEFKNDKYYVSDLHYGNVVFDKDGKPHIIDADVKYYGRYRRENIEGKPIVVDRKEPADSKSLFESLRTKKGKEYYDTVTELAKRRAEKETLSRHDSLLESDEQRLVQGGNGQGNAGRRQENVGILSSAIQVIAEDQRRAIREGRERPWKDETTQQSSTQLRPDTSRVSIGLSGELKRSIEERVVEWAKKNGVYVNENAVRENSFGNKMLANGIEARVYLSKDKRTVTKFVKYNQLNRADMGKYVDFVSIYNSLFPETAYRIIGVSEDRNNTANIVVTQPFVDGERKSYQDWESNGYGDLFSKYLASKGFVRDDDFSFHNDDYYISDLHNRNVLFKDGKPVVIDANIITKDEYMRLQQEEADMAKAKIVDSLSRLRPSVLKADWSNLDALVNELKNFRIDDSHPSPHFRVLTAADDMGRPQTESVVENHVQRLGDKLGVHVNMMWDVEDIPDPKVKADLQAGKKVAGWYDEKTGKVYLYMPNVRDTYTAEKTIWHEVVGHRGLRGLMGKEFNQFLRSLWNDLDSPINKEMRAYVKSRMDKDALSFYDAIEEYLAESAEKGKGEPGFWNNIKNKFSDILHEIGYRIAPNVKDVKYLLWLSKNLQKRPNDPTWRMRANAVRFKIENGREGDKVEYRGVTYSREREQTRPEDMSKENFDESTDGQIHFRTTPSAAFAIDRYQKALAAHGYMFTEAHMDSMLSLKNLLLSYLPQGTKIEDVKSSENPYLLQNTMQDAMSKVAERYEREIMTPLSKTVAGLLDAFDGKNDVERLRNFNLYLIKKHGLERNRVFFVRDAINELRSKDETAADAEQLQSDWDAEKERLGDQLRNGQIDLREYYNQMDEWIRHNVEPSFNAGEHDASGFHGMYGIGKKNAYDDAQVIDEIMNAEEAMEQGKNGSVKDLWEKIRAATSFAIHSDYRNGLTSKELYEHTSRMFDWYVPLRKFDDTAAEDVYGYINQKGDASSYLGQTIAKASGRKSLSNVNVLAQVGAMANNAIFNGGNNQIRQAFARFVRNHYDVDADNRLVTECNVWVEKKGTDANGKDIWEEVFPAIDADMTPEEIAQEVSDFETDMKSKQAQGLAKNINSGGHIPFRFNRAKNKSEHIVQVKIAGRSHNFIINANPRAAQALNGMLVDRDKKWWTKLNSKVTRFMAQACTSFNPEFVARNMVKDFEFSNLNLLAKEGATYTYKFEKYYFGLLPFLGIKGLKTISSSNLRDIGGSDSIGLFAKYRRNELDLHNKTERYFKEFMDNGGQTGFVQMKNMKDWEKKYKLDILKERNAAVKTGKALATFFFGNVENLNEVAENIARFSTYCASRESGRSIVRSVYDAKEVTVNFNRTGSGNALSSFMTPDMGAGKKWRKGMYGFSAGYLKSYSMFYNAGIQSTNMLLKNAKNNPISTAAYISSLPFALGVLMPLINQMIMGDEDKKVRSGIEDPYAELPDFVRRNNICIYKGGGQFITIPLAIETRAFYGLGDLAHQLYTGETDMDVLNITQQSVGQITQLVPVMDYLCNKDFGESPIADTFQAVVLPSTMEPIAEWLRNKDWKGSQIERRTEWNKYDPAWERAYTGVNEGFMDLNKRVNAMTNDVDPGNPEMLGSSILDEMTNPSMLEHFVGGIGKGAATFLGKVDMAVTQKAQGQTLETKDIPFLRSFVYSPSEATSLMRTKTKWYNYKDEVAQAQANVKKLKKRTNDPEEALHNSAKLHQYKEGKVYQKIEIIERTDKALKRIDKMRNKTTDADMVKGYDDQKNQIILQAVEQLDKLN